MTRLAASVKFFILLSLAVFCFGLWIGSAPADEKPSAEVMAEGRKLFNAKDGLGVKFACILCHQKDKAIKKTDLEKAGDKLPNVINKYLVEKAKGKPLAPDGPQMKALMAYIRYEHSK